ncbi:unnamed protein product [Aureobasidium pullulans]|nr:unnamed protein product [Aureobasidium pullulans]
MTSRLVLCLGDLFIPDRANDIPAKFKKLLTPGKIGQILCLGNLTSPSVYTFLRNLAPDLQLVKGDFDISLSTPAPPNPNAAYAAPTDQVPVPTALSKVVTHGGLRIGFTHGHTIVPPGDPDSLLIAARQMDVDVLCWGGTCKFEAYEMEGKFFVNPGSATGAVSWSPDAELDSEGEAVSTPSFVLMDQVQGDVLVLYVYQLRKDQNGVENIKSSTNITSLNAVILGLFENSLDAKATKIDVSVDFRRGGCTVEDNGLGVLPCEFRETGGLGRMYHTSKHQDNAQYENHGGQGTFLASTGALSLLTITSRHFQHYSHNTLVLHRSKPISRLTPAPPQHEIRSHNTHGTRVSVKDLFGNMPVRVKQRANYAEEGSEVERQWQALRVGVVGLLLPWNRHVKVIVTDSGNSAKTFSINTGAHFLPNTLSERNLNILNKKTLAFDQNTILSILSQSGIIAIDSKSSWIPVSASTLSVVVKGLISLDPAPSRAAQFISIGITPCLDENRHNELYETVNRIFAQSSFGHVDDNSEPDEAEVKRRQHDRRFKQDADESAQPVSKLSDMRLKSIVNVLESLTMHWLEANNFRPKKTGRKRKQAHQSTAAADQTLEAPGSRPASASLRQSGSGLLRTSSQASITSDDNQGSKRVRCRPRVNDAIPTMPFTDWSRIKSARPQMYESIWKCKTPQLKQTLGDSARTAGTPTPISVEPVFANQFGFEHCASPSTTKEQGTMGDERYHIHDQADEAYIDWVDPKTHQKHRINARTGIVMPDQSHRTIPNDTPANRTTAAADSRLSSFGRSLVLERRKSTPRALRSPTSNTTSASPWLDAFLQTWKNPTFANQPEQAIPTVGFGGPGQEAPHSHDHHQRCAIVDSFSHAGTTDTSRLSKSALSHAHVISQVDDKFILMKIPSLSGPKSEELDHTRQLLALMDQHAASERCILEALLEELCAPNQGTMFMRSNLGFTSAIITNPVDKPLYFQLPIQEEQMFRTHAQHFASWGILYDLISSNKIDPPRLNILTLPPGISERCKTEPKLIMELLRGEIYALAETGSTRSRPADVDLADTKHAWLRRMGSCPKA